MKRVCPVLALLIFAGPLSAGAEEKPSVDFERQIWPILVSRCNACHGEEEQEGQLRLDAKAIVFRGGVSGPAVRPGKAEESLLLQRVLGEGEEEQMPLDDNPLSADEIALLKTWINEGAVWPAGLGSDAREVERHWAYERPEKAPAPKVSQPDWVVNPIDAWVLARLDQEGLRPSPAAGKAQLLRRVSLDLIGLPPTLEELETFLADDRPEAYALAVDRLLASPHYGERWARQWLDLARYADSNGYQADQYRSVWPYRDWVINAMNANMPFDQFTREQLAGDLLPDATLQQKIATGFHRLTTCNVEAGVDPEENRVNQVIDRVNTTGYVWLGSTIECAQCHNHKYDPFAQKDYYQLFAYFNNTPLEVSGNGVTYNFIGPTLDLPFTPEQRAERDQARNKVKAAEKNLAALVATRTGFDDWLAAEDSESPPGPQPEAIAKVLLLPPEKRNAKQLDQLREYYQDLDPKTASARKKVAAARTALEGIKPTTSLVMIEQKEPRETHLFQRGNFLTPGEAVAPGVPGALHPLPAEAPANRLGLARWLTDENNPLTPRVVVNRWWAEFFGRGIVATLEDFGSQSEPATHPQLLDWLARDFVDEGWSMKHLHRTIVLSNTYRQSSRITSELQQQDPENHLLARGPRYRMSAEMLRDNALVVSGLLSREVGGPPVYPPQPDGHWRHVGRNAPKYATSEGPNRFRRGVYVFWRRSAPYPSFTNFDAPDRASCVVQRARTNTPLQALTLLNDPAYLEMAEAFAHQIVASGLPSPAEKVEYAFRRTLARRPQPEETDQLLGLYEQERARLADDPAAVKKLVPTGDDTLETAAWFFVAHVLLNLDETITKE
ncbi:PSD1 and planctomycete cytochrome C domain-containing protein [Lignipirellula cremea]|uniref:Planctomycete cytochrome C n=1 Tax=Lignipirellula cremea TaxID=2528010 RepID=A0A518E121_9BACT|nr:PSD1 and planctomycete cytochrome C domain-containing protein [Lignipirellula cremea]QDU97796.1 Planctomycete cytochrome C [Lignipirellula cremea]